MDRSQDDSSAAASRTGGHGAQAQGAAGPGSAAPGAAGLPEWEAAVGPGARCLSATTRRYRVKARNPARAALRALQRHGLTGAEAQAGNACVAVHLLPDARTIRAIYAVAGTSDTPRLELRYARLLPDDAPQLGPGGPLDLAAVTRELPRAARRRAQLGLGTTGVRELLRGTFWQREASLYSSTALVLAALGFPMTPEVFAVGGLLLLTQGAVRLAIYEARVAARTRALLAEPALRDDLRQEAARMLFLRVHQLGETGARAARRVLCEQVAVPDLTGAARLRLLIDEDAAVTTGAGAAGTLEEDALPASDNRLTVVFHRPRRRAEAAAAETPARTRPAAQADAAAPAPDPGLPVPAGRRPPADHGIEVIEAELLDPEAYFGGPPPRDWWA